MQDSEITAICLQYNFTQEEIERAIEIVRAGGAVLRRSRIGQIIGKAD
jgi:hypothetical protein